MRLDLSPPADGWITVRLDAPGVALEFPASATPRDSLGDLARTVATLLAGDSDAVVVWNGEPAETEFRFTTASGWTRLEIHRFPDAHRHRRRDAPPIAVIEAETRDLARTLWRSLRRVQGAALADAFAAAWGHPFPAATVRRLGESLADGPPG